MTVHFVANLVQLYKQNKAKIINLYGNFIG